MITPIDTEGVEIERSPERNAKQLQSVGTSYQLTHDFLVPSIREWLAREKLGTIAGRTELRLQQQSEIWGVRPEPKYLPGFLDWLRILIFTKRKRWTTLQAQMVRATSVRHIARLAVMFVILVALGTYAFETLGRAGAAARFQALLGASPAQMPARVQELKPYHRWARPELRRILVTEVPGTPKQIRALAALLSTDDSHARDALEAMLHAPPQEFAGICRQLLPHRTTVLPRLREICDNPDDSSDDVSLRAACALAIFDPTVWPEKKLARRVVEWLIRQPQGAADFWFDALRPVRSSLQPLLVSQAAYQRDALRRAVATYALLQLCQIDIPALVKLVPDFNVDQLRGVLPRLQRDREKSIKHLKELLLTLASPTLVDADWEELPARTVARIENAHGLVTPQFALFQSLPIGNLQGVLQQMKRCRYRALRVRPYRHDRAIRVAATFLRSDASWHVTWGHSAEEVQGELQQRQSDEMPVDVVGYADPTAKSNRYAVVWHGTEKPVARRVFVELTRQQSSNVFTEMRLQQEPVTRSLFVGFDGQLRFTQIWQAQQQHSTWYMYWGLPGEYRELVDGKPKTYLADSCISGNPEEELAWAFVMFGDPHHTVDCTDLFDVGLEHHQEEARALAIQAYRPVSISVAQLADGLPRSASVWHRPSKSPSQDLWRKRAKVASVLFRLGEFRPAQQLLSAPADATRVYLIQQLGQLATAGQLGEFAKQVDSPLALQGALAALTQPRTADDQSEELQAMQLELYRTHPSPAVHSALKSHATRDAAKRFASPTLRDRGDRSWYVNPQGKTMNVHSSGGRSYAVADSETTVAEFVEFFDDFPYLRGYSQTSDSPINSVSWFDAVAYCHELNLMAGIPASEWCYVPVPEAGATSSRSRPAAWMIPPDHATRTGYRLMREDEVRYVLGQTHDATSRQSSLLDQLSWLAINSDGPCSSGGGKVAERPGLLRLAWQRYGVAPRASLYSTISISCQE